MYIIQNFTQSSFKRISTSHPKTNSKVSQQSQHSPIQNGFERKKRRTHHQSQSLHQRPLVFRLRKNDLRNAVRPHSCHLFSFLPLHFPPHYPKSQLIPPYSYNPFVPELQSGRHRARLLTHKYNTYLPSDSTPDSLVSEREKILKEIVGTLGPRSFIDPPFRVDYGCNISIGSDFYGNFK